MGGRDDKFLQPYGNGKFREEKGKEPSLPDTEYEGCVVYIWISSTFPGL